MFWKKKKKEEDNPRRHKRMQADYLIMYREVSKLNEEPLVSNIKDISASGVRFLVENFIAEGTPIKISMAIPPIRETIESDARVVRCRQSARGPLYYLSVVFENLPKDAQTEIDLFIERLSEKKGARFMVDHHKKISRRINLERPPL